MKQGFLILLFFLSASVGNGKTSAVEVRATNGLICTSGATLQEAKTAFNNNFVGRLANEVTIRGAIDKGKLLVRKLSDLVVTTIDGKVFICALATSR